MVRSIVGANWGDEGKGKITDVLAERSDVVVRFQGGANAGHTIINNYGKFALHLLPSGVFHQNIANIIGPGVALDIEKLLAEYDSVVQRGVPRPKLYISDRAQVMLPYHVDFDRFEEERLGKAGFGSTKSGIAPFYGDKYLKIGIQVCQIYDEEILRQRLSSAVEQKNVTLANLYHKPPIDLEALIAHVRDLGERIRPMVIDTTLYLHKALKEGKTVLLEGQLGSLRDPDHGIYPYTTSSNPIAAYAPVGSGLPTAKLDKIIGVVKAYSSCVGEGPFTCEWFGEEAEKLREAGGEYGAKTGRPRRVGPIDLVATRYGVQCQGATDIALTKLDVLSYMDEIPICARYELNGQETDAFPFPAVLPDAKPVMTAMPGWKCDISGVRKWENLPEAARNYVEYVEREIGCHITYVSVGPERDSIIIR